MAAERAIGVHVRHDMEPAFLQQGTGVGISGIGEHFQRALHPPFGHAFAGMLARIEPDLRIALTHFDAVYRLPLKRIAQSAAGHALDRCHFRNQVMVTVDAVWREIGEPHDIAGGGVADGQCALVLVIAAVGAAPIFAVFADTGIIAGPALRIGGLFQPVDVEFQSVANFASDAKMEPLEEITVFVFANRQFGLGAGNVVDGDVSAIESGGNLNAHGTVIVVPDSPGKSLNNASANLEAARAGCDPGEPSLDRKSTRLNSSHVRISYAVFCLKKKKKTNTMLS